MQTTKDLIYKLESADYPLRFIAKQAGVSYTRLYRYMANDTPISPEDEARIRRFAIVQPCIMDGSVHDD